MSAVADLTASIKSRVSALLGVDYSELTNVTEIAKNSFKGAEKRYGVISNESNEVEGTTCHLTLDQTFQVILTNGYYSNVKASDADKRTKTIELQDLMQDIYSDLKVNKAGSPGIVIHTFGLSVESPEYLEENHVVAIRGSFTIKHRKTL